MAAGSPQSAYDMYNEAMNGECVCLIKNNSLKAITHIFESDTLQGVTTVELQPMQSLQVNMRTLKLGWIYWHGSCTMDTASFALVTLYWFV